MPESYFDRAATSYRKIYNCQGIVETKRGNSSMKRTIRTLKRWLLPMASLGIFLLFMTSPTFAQGILQFEQQNGYTSNLFQNYKGIGSSLSTTSLDIGYTTKFGGTSNWKRLRKNSKRVREQLSHCSLTPSLAIRTNEPRFWQSTCFGQLV